MIDPKLVEQVARVLHSAYCGCDERPNGHDIEIDMTVARSVLKAVAEALPEPGEHSYGDGYSVGYNDGQKDYREAVLWLLGGNDG